MPLETDRSLKDVVQDIFRDAQELFRSEVRLAKEETREEINKARKAATWVAAGGLLGLYAVGFLLLCLFFALTAVVSAWFAALFTALLVGVVAAVLLDAGMRRMKRVQAKPARTIDTVKENIEWARERTR
ncbi:MAG: phage holin family protein [Bryobacteraceae bacterium]